MSDGAMKEFLVSLGYVVDEHRAKDWERSLAKVRKGIEALAAALLSAEAAIVALVAKTSISLDRANWSATRAGTSVANLQALTYALRQTGRVNTNPVDAFAAELRNFPSVEGIVRSLGVKTRENGALRDTTEMLLDAVEATRRMSYVRGAHVASLLGISEPDYDHLRRNVEPIRAFMAERKAEAGAMGFDPDRGGLQSTIAMQSYRSAMMQIEIAIQAALVAVAPILLPIIDGLDAWIIENREAIKAFATQVVEAAIGFTDWFANLVAALVPVAETFGDVVEAATGEKGLVVAIEALSGVFLAGFVLRILGVVGRVRLALLALVATVMTGKYVVPQIFDFGVREAPTGPDERSKPSMWQKVTEWVREKTGAGSGKTPSAGKTGGGTQIKGASDTGPALDRSSFDDELKDPRVRDRLMALTEAEVGGQHGQNDQQKFMETIFNRAKAEGRTLWEVMHGRYFPASTHSNAASYSGKPFLETKYADVLDKVRKGSNVANYATGNESGNVRSGGAEIVATGNGERYVVENWTVGWVKRAKEEAARKAAETKRRAQERDEIIRRLEAMPPVSLGERDERRSPLRMDTPWGSPSDKVQSGPLIEQPDEHSAVETNRTTKITVHGDCDPNTTADEVGRHQRRVNTDMITTTGQAFA